MEIPITIVLLISIALSLDFENCFLIECESNLSSNKCITVSDSTVKLNDCGELQYCSDYSQLNTLTDTWTEVLCQTIDENEIDNCLDPPTDLSLATGSICCESINCISNLCVEGHCKGINTGSACKSDHSCETGTYCDKKNSICISTFKEGEECV